MTKIYALAFAAAVTAAVLAVPVYSQDIVVTSERSVSAFVEDVSSNLDRELNRTQPRWRTEPSGFAIVRFECGENGKPENIALYRQSGDREVDRIAQHAVSRLASLHPLPATIRDGQLIQANIVIAQSDDQHERLTKHLRQHEKARLASSAKEHEVLALTAGTRRTS